MSLFVILGLLVCIEARGTSVAPVFVQTGDDLLLDVDADVPEVFSFVEWNFNKTVILVRFAPGGESNVFPDFTGRIEFPEKNFSVKLKNLQKADSGVYTAQLETITKKQQLAEYKVTVQDPGPKPNPYLIPVIVTIVILIVIILLVLYFYRRRTGKYERENNENTIYENPQVATTAQPQDGSPTDDASGPTSTYSMVGPHTGPLDPSETRGRTLPESLYATVEKHTGSFNNS